MEIDLLKIENVLSLLLLIVAGLSFSTVPSHSAHRTMPAANVNISITSTTPAIKCDRKTKIWYSNSSFKFNVAGRFAGKVHSYRFAWDQSPTHTWTDTEELWSSNTLYCNAGCQNSWYLHLKGYDDTGTPTGVLDLGPYNYRSNKITRWSRIYEGVEAATGFKYSPRLMRAFAIKVDLQNKHVSLVASHGKGSELGVGDPKPGTLFLSDYGCKVTVNANFAWPANKRSMPTPDPTNIWGVVISNGITVSGPHSYPFNSAICFTKDNVATIGTYDSVPPGIYTAVGGSEIFLSDGQTVSENDDVQPRTFCGLSWDKRYLFLIVVDGRQPGWSMGCQHPEAADWLRDFGGWYGMMMDGGGSSAIVREDIGVWNHSCWNTKDRQDIRPVTVHLGIKTTK